MPDRQPEPLVPRRAVSAHLGVPVTTLAQWAYRGAGPPYYTVGRHAMYRMSEVEQWLAERRHQPEPA